MKITLSSPILQKQACKKCHSPPTIIKKIGKLFIDERSLEEIIKESSKAHFFYLLDPSVIGDCIEHRSTDRIKLAYLNFSTTEFKISISQHRKHKINQYYLKNKNINALLHCKCSKTYWIVSCMDKNFYPELNRKKY